MVESRMKNFLCPWLPLPGFQNPTRLTLPLWILLGLSLALILLGGCQVDSDTGEPPPSYYSQGGGGGNGNGGGNGGGGDSTPPGEVTNFTATAGDGQVTLAWSNPTDSDFAGVRICWSDTSQPTEPLACGANYSDIATPGVDTTVTGLDNDTLYYFTAFAYDGTPNYSSGVIDNATPNPSIEVQAASGTNANLDGTTWTEPCYEQDPGVYVTGSMTFTATGASRTETAYSDSTCSTSTGTETFDFSITNDGDKTGVPWEGDTPPSTTASVTATKVTISGTESDGTAYTFKTLFFVNDNATPNQLLFGNDEEGAVLDSNDYPTTMHVGGSSKDGTTTIDISSGSNGATTTNIAGATWAETCSDRGNGEWTSSTMTFTSPTDGSRDESWYSDAACTALTYTSSMILNVISYGDQTGVTWAGGTAPTGLDDSVTATKVVITANDDQGGRFMFRTLMYVNDQVIPNQLLLGNEDGQSPEPLPDLDSESFPTTMWDVGSEKQ